MDIRIRGTKAEIDAELPRLIAAGLRVRNMYGKGEDVSVFLQPSEEWSGSSPASSPEVVQAPTARFGRRKQTAFDPPPPAMAPQQAPLPALESAQSADARSLRDHFHAMGLRI